MKTLATEHIGKQYDGRRVVRDVNIEIKLGEVVGLLGPNGAGKTTSFYMIVGLVRPDEGSICVDGVDITRTPMYLRAREYGISYLPQEPSIFRKLNVEENILAVLENTAAVTRGPACAHRRSHRKTKPGPRSQNAGLCAERRRAAPRGNRALPGDFTRVHPAG